MAKWDADTLNAAMDALVSNGQLMDRIKAQDAAIAELVEGLREMCAAHDRIMGDTHWRTNDNTLWPDACAAGKTARALIAKYGDKTDD